MNSDLICWTSDQLRDLLMEHNCGGVCPCADCKLAKEILESRNESSV